jgi:hypothetical protein
MLPWSLCAIVLGIILGTDRSYGTEIYRDDMINQLGRASISFGQSIGLPRRTNHSVWSAEIEIDRDRARFVDVRASYSGELRSSIFCCTFDADVYVSGSTQWFDLPIGDTFVLQGDVFDTVHINGRVEYDDGRPTLDVAFHHEGVALRDQIYSLTVTRYEDSIHLGGRIDINSSNEDQPEIFSDGSYIENPVKIGFLDDLPDIPNWYIMLQPETGNGISYVNGWAEIDGTLLPVPEPSSLALLVVALPFIRRYANA